MPTAKALGRRADELVGPAGYAAEPVVAPARAAAALRETFRHGAHSAALPDERLVRLAAGLSQTAALPGPGRSGSSGRAGKQP